MESVDFTIIGSGICGVLTARLLKKIFPDREVLLLDKEPFPGHHNTTRNSGVLHAGIYYEHKSLKHLLCMKGHEQWVRLSKEYEIPLEQCGKFIIATQESELQALELYYEKATRNQVPDIRWMFPEEMNEISEYTNVVKGFFSPHTGILDISTGIKTLFADLTVQGIITMLNTGVLTLSRMDSKILVRTDRDEFLTTCLINCAGAGAVTLRKQLGLLDVEDKFVKGHYLKLNKPFYNRRLIYPVPLKNLAGLGVHTSFHLDKIIRFGPNTEEVSEIDYKNSEANIDIMYPAIQEKFKGIQKSDLSLDYVGVRTKIIKNGALYTDFLIQGPSETNVAGYFEAIGIESPGMTAAPAIADLLGEKIQAFLKNTL